MLLRYDDTEYLIVTGRDDVVLERLAPKLETHPIASNAAPPLPFPPALPSAGSSPAVRRRA